MSAQLADASRHQHDPKLILRRILKLENILNEGNTVAVTKLVLPPLEQLMNETGLPLHLSEKEKKQRKWRRFLQEDAVSGQAVLKLTLSSLFKCASQSLFRGPKARETAISWALRDMYFTFSLITSDLETRTRMLSDAGCLGAQYSRDHIATTPPSDRGRSRTSRSNGPPGNHEGDAGHVFNRGPSSVPSSHYERHTIAPTMASSRAGRSNTAPSIHITPPSNEATPQRVASLTSDGGLRAPTNTTHRSRQSRSRSADRSTIFPSDSISSVGDSGGHGARHTHRSTSSRPAAVAEGYQEHSEIPQRPETIAAESHAGSFRDPQRERADDLDPSTSSHPYGHGAAAEYYAQSMADQAGETMPFGFQQGDTAPSVRNSHARTRQSQASGVPGTSATSGQRAHTPSHASSQHKNQVPWQHTDTAGANSRASGKARSDGSRAPAEQQESTSISNSSTDSGSDSGSDTATGKSSDHDRISEHPSTNTSHHTGPAATPHGQARSSTSRSRASSKATRTGESHRSHRSQRSKEPSSDAPSHASCGPRHSKAPSSHRAGSHVSHHSKAQSSRYAPSNVSVKSKVKSFGSKVFDFSGESKMQSEAKSEAPSHHTRKSRHSAKSRHSNASSVAAASRMEEPAPSIAKEPSPSPPTAKAPPPPSTARAPSIPTAKTPASTTSREPAPSTAAGRAPSTVVSEIDMFGFERKEERERFCHHTPSMAPTYCDSVASTKPA